MGTVSWKPGWRGIDAGLWLRGIGRVARLTLPRVEKINGGDLVGRAA